MSSNSRIRMSVAIAGIAALAIPLAACGSDTEGEVVEGMGNATPAPAAGAPAADPAGTVAKLDKNVTGALVLGDRILLRAGSEILSGTPDKPAMKVSEVDAACGDLAPAGNVAVLPCPDGIHVLAADGSATAVIGRGTAYSAAVGLSDGRIVGHRSDSDRVDVFGADGEHADDFPVSRHGSQLLSVPSTRESAVLLEVNRPETSVHEIILDESRRGSGLRAGIGVGPAAVGEDGTIAAVDVKGGQLLIYTAGDVVRLHNSTPVPKGPWAVAVDSARKLVWVTSTVDGVLTAYDISSGTALKAAQLPLIADAQALAITRDGGLVAYSATGAGAQHLTAGDVGKALEEGKADLDAERKLMKPREPENRLPAGAGDGE
ncbi:hypothetical protein ACFORJ_11975 [Corynebacterium hansenii]|uniref:Prolipoprotein LppL n=1 Tax=Corynebacterium hansenii TaxID=394964 RepID=A0ABV7ZUR7_9CORY|nr:hypothetical protein [Corynebacterium hansenii]WJZ00019.1 hypothetical protein CHAN_07025 [Corynebacterium hansenii]